MTIKLVAYRCNQCDLKFLHEEQEFCASGAAFGFRSPSHDLKCPKCGSPELTSMGWDPKNAEELTKLYGNRFEFIKGAKGGKG